MADTNLANPSDSVADILSRAFESAALPVATAELILRAKLPESDIQRVEALLEQKRETSLTPEQELLLQDYLQADSFLTLLKSKARQSLKHAMAA